MCKQRSAQYVLAQDCTAVSLHSVERLLAHLRTKLGLPLLAFSMLSFSTRRSGPVPSFTTAWLHSMAAVAALTHSLIKQW